MAKSVISAIPEFAEDTPTSDAGIKEVGQVPQEAAAEEVAEEEKETPSEPPAEEKPAETLGLDTGELEKELQGLKEDRIKLIKELADLRGQRRELKQQEVQKLEQQIDELKDLHPDDVKLIDRVLRSKGFITKEDTDRMFYDSVKQEELNKFLEKYPEYKPENDLNDHNWTSLQREIGFYRMPENPHLIGEVLERAHRGVTRISSDRSIPLKKKQVELAGVGAGGTQRSSSQNLKKLDSQHKTMLELGGWSEEEISKIEQNLKEE